MSLRVLASVSYFDDCKQADQNSLKRNVHEKYVLTHQRFEQFTLFCYLGPTEGLVLVTIFGCQHK